jgi:hypothetical protein
MTPSGGKRGPVGLGVGFRENLRIAEGLGTCRQSRLKPRGIVPRPVHLRSDSWRGNAMRRGGFIGPPRRCGVPPCSTWNISGTWPKMENVPRGTGTRQSQIGCGSNLQQIATAQQKRAQPLPKTRKFSTVRPFFPSLRPPIRPPRPNPSPSIASPLPTTPAPKLFPQLRPRSPQCNSLPSIHPSLYS